MITFVFSVDAVLHCRFGVSPVGEVVLAARALGAAPRDTAHYATAERTNQGSSSSSCSATTISHRSAPCSPSAGTHPTS